MTVAWTARTRAGVGIGDSSDRVRDRYARSRCYTANEGSEYATFPLCEVELRRGVRRYFGADPIRSIWLIVSGESAFRKLLRGR